MPDAPVAPAALTPQSTLREVLAVYPGAQRALFRHFHIGGCSSCAFSPEETIEQLCARNGGLDPAQVLDRIKTSHEEDARIFIEPKELADWRAHDPGLRLLDVRSREEFEAVHIPGSVLMSQPVMREILGEGTNMRPLIIIDHQGRHSLDAAAYFIGHGLQNVRCLRGGLDAWSQEVDPTVRRYRVG
ncbi:MAG TPA: rhodanese-like domain-containing protein [Clostridia bacterium]|nr:rhodanese-like domain-containing protein [Clostridia bacterium]